MEAGTGGVEKLQYQTLQKQFMEATITSDYMTMQFQCVSPAAWRSRRKGVRRGGAGMLPADTLLQVTSPFITPVFTQDTSPCGMF